MALSGKNLTQILLVAIAIFVCGWLGQLLAVPPGYASPLWPPAGIALVAVLLKGRRVLPGVFIGSCGLNTWIGLHVVGSHGVEVYFSAIGIALGSSLQAVVAVWLVERFVRPSSTYLASLPSILTFLTLAGPVASLVAPTVGVGSLISAGIMPASIAFNSWLHWWMGDSLGAITVAPLLLCFFASPEELWRPRRFTYAIPLLVVLCALMLVFSSVYRQEQRQLQLIFENQASPIEKQIQTQIAAVSDAIMTTVGFFESSESVERAEFTTFATGVIKIYPQLQALSWAPKVTEEGVRSFEAEARRNGLPRFSITEKDPSGALIPGHSGMIHFPIFYIEPLSGNEAALGFDLLSERNRRIALEHSGFTGQLAITERLQLVQDSENNTSILAVAPVFTGASDSKELIGYVTGVVRITPLIEQAIARLDTRHLSILLQDQSASAGNGELYIHAGHYSSQNSTIKPRKSIISIGGRTWFLTVGPDGDYVAIYGSWLPWFTLTGGLVLSALLSILILFVTGHSSQVKLEVMARTQELSASERRLRAIIDASPVPFALNDDKQNITYLNPAFTKAFGYTQTDIPTLDAWWPRAYPDVSYRNWAHQEWQRHMDYAESHGTDFEPLEIKVRAKDGQDKTTIVGAAPLGESYAGMHLVYLFDITERKRAETLLQVQQDKLHQILENSPIAIRIAASSGSRVLFANRSYAKLINSDPGNMIGVDPRPYYANPAEYEEIVHEIKKGHSIHERQVELNIPGRGTIWTLASYLPIEYQGETAVLGWFYDVTELYAAKDMAERLARMKSEFLANMSHEIRTPMNGVIGLSQLALNEAVSPKVRDYLEKINSSSESLLGILNDILDLSKLESGKFTINHQRFDLDKVIENIRNLFLHRAEEKSLDFHIEMAEDTPIDLIGDALRLQQVLANLVGNAIKFTEQGDVFIRVHPLGKTESHVQICFMISDTGIGISDADQKILFSPFSQVDTSATRRFGGTGLGLAISKNLLELMGSALEVESIPGMGTTFSFTLPVLLASEKCHRAIAEAPAKHQTGTIAQKLLARGKALSGVRVLVVEDNPINQRVVSEFLKLSDVIVDIAHNGIEALEKISSKDYRAILMDVHMPGMGGIEATQRIRANPKYANLPIIALTAGVTQGEQENCFKAGMNDFLPKPINPENLIEKLAKWIEPQEAPTIGASETQFQPTWDDIQKQLVGFELENLAGMIGKDAELLQSLLASFYESYAEISEKISASIAREDYADAQQLIHHLKGTAGNLGARELYDACGTLEAELKEGKPGEHVMREWRKVFAHTMALLKAIADSARR